MKPKLIIFDCDGTLVDSEAIAAKFFTEYWSSFGVNYTEEEFKELFIGTGSNHPIVIETFSKMPAHVAAEGDRLFKEALKKDLFPVKGMENLINSLSNLMMCVASNSSLSYLDMALTKTGLSPFFGDKVFSSEQVKNPKPAADLFLFVCEKMGVEPKNALVIEDSVSGIKAAQNAGIPVVGFTGAGHFNESLANKIFDLQPNFRASTIEELKNIIS